MSDMLDHVAAEDWREVVDDATQILERVGVYRDDDEDGYERTEGDR